MDSTAIKLQDQDRTTSAVASSVTKRRFLYIDNLRMALITAVIVGHISVTYGVIADWYYYEEGEISPFPFSLMMLAAGIGIGSVIGLFFLISGYFTPGAYDHKGAGKFMIDRLKRLRIPLLIYGLLINPLVHYAVDVHGGECKGSFYDCQFQGTSWSTSGNTLGM